VEASGDGARLVGSALNECTLRQSLIVNAYYMDGFVCPIMMRANFSQLGGEWKDKYRYELEAVLVSIEEFEGGFELSMCFKKTCGLCLIGLA
jgi:hypothetical protein